MAKLGLKLELAEPGAHVSIHTSHLLLYPFPSGLAMTVSKILLGRGYTSQMEEAFSLQYGWKDCHVHWKGPPSSNHYGH